METKSSSKSNRLRSAPERRYVLLPEEIIEEILLRLAVKSLLRFRCVSKSYCSLIDNKRFIKSHHQKSSSDSSLAHHRVLSFCSYTHTHDARAVSGCSLLSFLDGSADDKASKLNLPFNVTRGYKIYLVGCCNGLVCILLRAARVSGQLPHRHVDVMNRYQQRVGFHDVISQFILWNPSTRVSKILPQDNINRYQHVGFGWDESSNDYKVILLRCPIGHTMCKLYNLKSDSWDEIDACDTHSHPYHCYLDRFGKLANGKLYWDYQVSGETEIIAFDLKRDVFEIVEEPRYSEGYFYVCLGTFGEEFAVMYCNNKGYKEIWAKKEYIYNGVKDEPWVKVMVVYDYAKCDIWTAPCVHAFHKGAKGDILLMNMYYYDKIIIAYDLKNKFFHGRPGSPDSDIYVESLVSPFVTNVGLERDEPNHPTPADTDQDDVKEKSDGIAQAHKQIT